MAQYRMSGAPGVDFLIEYNASNGKVTGFTCQNTTGMDAYGQARLTDGRVFGQVFGQGSTTVAIPPNVVSLSVDGNNEPTWTNLAGVDVRVPA